MNLLKAYNYAKKTQYPHIVICGDELLATSDHGLFVCSTKDLSSKYLPNNNIALTSLTSISNRSILLSENNWYFYERETGIKKFKTDTAITFNNSVNIQPGNFGNLFYLTSNAEYH